MVAESDEESGKQKPKAGVTLHRLSKSLSIKIGALAGIAIVAIVTALSSNIGERLTKEMFTGQEFTVNVETNEDAFRAATPSYFFEKPESELSPPPSDTLRLGHFHEWARANGGYDLGGTVFRLTVHARTKPVNIVSASVIDVRKLPPKSGIVVSNGGSGQGSMEVRVLSVELETRTVSYTPLGAAAAQDFAFEIDPGKSEEFLVHAVGMDCNCEWRMKLAAVVDGRAIDVTIDDEGSPFTTLSKGENNVMRHVAWNPANGWYKDPHHN